MSTSLPELKDSDVLPLEHRGGWWLRRVAGRAADVLLEALCPDPDRLFEQGTPIHSPWQSKATDKVVVQIRSVSYFLKRYNCLGWKYRLKNVFRRSRGQKSWDAAWHFHRLGIPTVTPLVWLEERPWRLLGSSILAFPQLTDARSLLELWPTLQDDARLRVLQLAADVIARMHRSGVLHGDLNWRNLLVRKTDAGPEIFLIDLDGCRYPRTLDVKTAEEDLAHFFRDLRRAGADAAWQERFAASWEQKVCSG